MNFTEKEVEVICRFLANIDAIQVVHKIKIRVWIMYALSFALGIEVCQVVHLILR